MSQDPNAVPYQRVSYEQAPALPLPPLRPSYQAEPAYQQAEPAYPAPEYPSYGDYDPAPRFPAHHSDTGQFRSPRFTEPRPWERPRDEPTQPHAEVIDSWTPEPGEAEDTALASLRDDQRTADRMQQASLALSALGVVIFLVCLAAHRLTGPVGLVAVVLMLAGLAGSRVYAARLARLRSQEENLLDYLR